MAFLKRQRQIGNGNMKKQTYDILGVGKRNQFFVRKGEGYDPIIVHNCGYGMGGPGFKEQIFAQAKVFLETEEATNLVQTYRNKYVDITNFWNQCNQVLKDMAAGGKGWFGGPDGKLFYYDGTVHIAGKRSPSIRLPDGLWLRYSELQMRERKYDDGTSKYAYCYYGIKEGRPTWIWTYGARLTENLCIAKDTLVMTNKGGLRFKMLLNNTCCLTGLIGLLTELRSLKVVKSVL